QAARRGVLVKGGVHLENLASIKAIAFDKTGTLTVGRPEVTDVVPMPGVTPQQLLSIAAAVESRSHHPLAQAVVRRAAQDQLELPRAGDLVSITAKGVRSEVEGEPVLIGSLKLWQRTEDMAPPDVVEAVGSVAARGRSVMVVRHGSRWLGVLGLADKPRESVGPTLDKLRSMGIAPLVMLTGDHRAVGEAIGKEVGVDEVVADLLPEQKVTALHALMA